MSEFKTECPECGHVKYKNNTWFGCVCGELNIHEQCPECGTLYYWNGEVHECTFGG